MFEAGRRYSDSPVLGVSLGPVDATVLSTLVSQGFAVNDTSTVTTAPRDDSVHEFVRGPAPLGPLQPTIDPTTGALVNPLTGGGIPRAMDPTSLIPQSPAGPYTVAATATQASGIVGTMDATPTQAEVLARQVVVTPDEANCRAVLIAYDDAAPATNKDAGPLWVTFNPGDDVQAAERLRTFSSGGQAWRVQPGERRIFGVGPTHDDISSIYLCHEYAAGGGGYTGLSSTIECYGEALATQLTLELASQMTANISDPYFYLPLHEASGSTAAGYLNGAAVTLTVDGTSPSSVWGNRGFWTPGTDNRIILTNSAYHDIIRPSTILDNCVWIHHTLIVPSLPIAAGTIVILDVGYYRGGSTYGGYRILLSSNSIGFGYDKTGAAPASLFTTGIASYGAGTELSVDWVLHRQTGETNITVDCYLNGNLAQSGQAAPGLPILDPEWPICIGANVASSTPTFDSYLGRDNATNAIRIGDLVFYRSPDATLIANRAAAAQAINKRRREPLAALVRYV